MGPSGQNQSAAICGRALVAAYDALKGVSSGLRVWGIGLSPRGNDRPAAVTNSSTTPVAFLAALGKWWRAYVAKTGRTTPLMDGFDFHPYPVPQSQPFAQGYSDMRSASVTNLARIYQAFWNAFAGTPQRTIGQQKGGGLRMSLNETGVQTLVLGKGGYSGSEVSATSSGGVLGAYATEAYQANWYLQMLNAVACDPNVDVVNIFHLIDEQSPRGLAERTLLRRPDAEALGPGRPRLDHEVARPLSGNAPAVGTGAAEGTDGEGQADEEEATAGGLTARTPVR